MSFRYAAHDRSRRVRVAGREVILGSAPRGRAIYEIFRALYRLGLIKEALTRLEHR